MIPRRGSDEEVEGEDDHQQGRRNNEDIHVSLKRYYQCASPYLRKLLHDDLGSEPHENILFHSRHLYAFAVRHRMRRYGDYVSRMRKSRCLLLQSFPALASKIPPPSSSSSNGAALFSEALGDGSTRRTSTQLLPEGLQQLDGILLCCNEKKKSGDWESGAKHQHRQQFLVPPSIVHYSEFMSQVAEMYVADGEWENEEGEQQDPSSWIVAGSFGAQLKQRLMTTFGDDHNNHRRRLCIPVVEIDMITDSLGYVAAYCTMVAAEHEDLYKHSLLDTDNLPVFPTNNNKNNSPSLDSNSPGESPEPPKELPVTTCFPQPFTHLSATTLLPSCGGEDLYPLVCPLFLKTSNYDQHHFLWPPNLPVKNIGKDPERYMFGTLRKFASKFVSVPQAVLGPISPIRPLEAVFALEALLPSKLHGVEVRGKRGNNGGDDGGAATVSNMVNESVGVDEEGDEVVNSKSSSFDVCGSRLVFKASKVAYCSESNAPLLGAFDDQVIVRSLVQVLFDFEVPCGRIQQSICGGRQVEPRLGYVSYGISAHPPDNMLSVDFRHPNRVSLLCTMDQFLDNAEAKAEHLQFFMSQWQNRDPQSVDTCHFSSFCHFSVVRQNPHFIYVRAYVRRMGRLQERPRISSSQPPTKEFDPLPFRATTTCTKGQATKGRNQSTDPTAPTQCLELQASFTRTVEVMKIASFLGLTALVDLCGVVLAILLQGNTVTDVQTMFSSCASME